MKTTGIMKTLMFTIPVMILNNIHSHYRFLPEQESI
jgi:hypothetical protein